VSGTRTETWERPRTWLCTADVSGMAPRLPPVLLLVFASVCGAQEFTQPTDGELRSAYCIPILQWQIDAMSRANSSVIIPGNDQTPEQQRAHGKLRRELEKVRSALDRLQSYLLPRMLNRDPMALALARKRGENDLQQLVKGADQCINECEAAKGEPAVCAESCIDKALVERMRACADPSWLPF
jgi:hypothetical protein